MPKKQNNQPERNSSSAQKKPYEDCILVWLKQFCKTSNATDSLVQCVGLPLWLGRIAGRWKNVC